MLVSSHAYAYTLGRPHKIPQPVTCGIGVVLSALKVTCWTARDCSPLMGVKDSEKHVPFSPYAPMFLPSQRGRSWARLLTVKQRPSVPSAAWKVQIGSYGECYSRRASASALLVSASLRLPVCFSGTEWLPVP